MSTDAQANWTRSDLYHNSFLLPTDDVLEHARKHSVEQGLPEIAVSAAQGKLLHLLARSLNAKRVLEVGTLGGYSAIWLARALPADGALVTCELEELHVRVAQANVDRAGLAGKVTIVPGPAADTLRAMRVAEPFDLAFIDADKEGNLAYFVEAKRMMRKGGVIIVDNVVRRGRVADPAESDEAIEGVRRLLEYLKTDKDVEATTIATVGEKGYDGFLYALLV